MMRSTQAINIEGLGKRLREAFNGAKNAQIAKRLNCTKSAVKNYIDGRATLPLLMAISEQTGYSVDWLLTGKGVKYLNPAGKISFDRLIEDRIKQIAEETVKEALRKFKEGIEDEEKETEVEKHQITQEKLNELEFDEKVREENKKTKLKKG
jgi:predicted transcriptional regulator